MFKIDYADRAQEHIKEIRKDFDLGHFGPSRHVKNLERALDLLSDQLYQKPTHFLLELIQNADDNEYDTATPSLTFTYEKRKLRIDCNEKGFSKANVEAICRIGQSTKTATDDNPARYVGEKGIGFKSVFKVADKVWISSNHYSFKFDKSQSLGMIAPKWEAFPQKTIPGVTSMLLELSPSYDQTILINELKRLDTRTLIFLRKLREINVHVSLVDQPPWETSLKQTESSHKDSTVTLSQNLDTFQYKISRHGTRNMPEEPKRAGMKTSEILLAFPMLDEHKEELDRQQVYAFLPIRDYGFKFLLQGDFLLSASREDILTDSPWNVALRDCFVENFVNVIEKGGQDQLRFHWPRFLPTESLPNGFFESARTLILDKLRTRPITQNRKGKFVRPTKLLQIPEEFRSKEGQPILALGNAENRFLSDEYNQPCLDPLEKLGVKKMELKDFVGVLKTLLADGAVKFREQSSNWHSEFARCLLAALWKAGKDKTHWNLVRELPIVPLDNNLWVAPSERGVFLPIDSKEQVEFGDLAVKLVGKQAAEDESRAALYKHLDIPVINQIEISNYIASSHVRSQKVSSDMTIAKLVSQTIYLFKAGWRNVLGQDLWFATQKNTFDRGSSLYVPSVEKYSASNYFGTDLQLFVHDNYFQAAESSGINVDEFRKWLKDCMHLWELPRLLTVVPRVGGGAMHLRTHDDFVRVIVSLEDPQWIHLLRDHFHTYSMFFDLGELLKHKLYGTKIGPRSPEIEDSHKMFLATLRRHRVKCSNGNREALEETYLPRPNLKEDGEGLVPMADVSDPEHADWQYLKRFGLGLEPDLQLYLRCLDRLHIIYTHKPATPETDLQISRCLDQIQARYTEDVNMVKHFFSSKNRIRVPPVNDRSPCRWVRADQCLWDGAKCFRRLSVLKHLYPSNATLFQKVLGIRNAELADLQSEASQLRYGDDLEHIRNVFSEIEKELCKDGGTELHNSFTKLRLQNIFPVTALDTETQSNLGYQSLRKVKPEVDWFIADRESLRLSFLGKLPILAFSVPRVHHLKCVMEKLKLDRYKLSRCAKSHADTQNTSAFDSKLTADLLERIPYVLRLIGDFIPIRTKRRIAKQLRSLRVYLADQLVQKWSVTLGTGAVVNGEPYQSNVVFATDGDGDGDGQLSIFLARKYFSSSVCKTDVVQHFADFCEIDDHLHLLSMALWESHAEIEEIFDNYGISEYDPMIDSKDPLDEDDDDDNVVQQDFEGDSQENNKKAAQVSQEVGSSSAAGAGATTATVPTNHPEYMNHGMMSSGSYSNFQGPFDLVCSHCAVNVRFAAIGLAALFGTRANGTHTNITCTNGTYTNSTSTNLYSIVSRAESPQVSTRYHCFSRLLGWSRQKPAVAVRDSVMTDFDLDYKGEQFISATLSAYLENEYSPNVHWTSKLRSRAGHRPFSGSTNTHATFTIPDTTGNLTRAMLQGHPDLLARWTSSPPTWHLEVKTTRDDVEAPFDFTNEQFIRARKFTAVSPTETPVVPRDVTVLVRVYNAGMAGDPQAIFYRDPWDMFLGGCMSLAAKSVYTCSVRSGQTPLQSGDNPAATRQNTPPADNRREHGRGKTVYHERPPPPYRRGASGEDADSSDESDRLDNID